jgi:hypothetical protein
MPLRLGASCERLDLFCERAPSLSPTLNVTLLDLGSRGVAFPDLGALEGLLGQGGQEGEIRERVLEVKGLFVIESAPEIGDIAASGFVSFR